MLCCEANIKKQNTNQYLKKNKETSCNGNIRLVLQYNITI